ncbi:hypothetical protein [Saccharothrix obliqua]|uniref:hypothetical protein n=1 Tax=Saccharothrix obliqua TaxID=2861747 RepID=UPI001C5EEE48|nr:hypothetical protein [Saccharothrix obliqua]MBW4721509.1 hypothetical protein [Saccharothrix obliqua]
MVVDDRAHRVLWRGAEASTQLPLPQSTSAALVVVSMAASEVRPVATVIATNPDPSSQLTPLTVVTTTVESSVTWGAIPGANSYVVTAGQADAPRQVGRTVEAGAVLPVTLGQSAQYQFTSNSIQDGHGKREGGGPVSYRYGVEITPPTTVIAEIPATASVGDEVAAVAPAIINTEHSYETFIPTRYIDAPEDPFGLTCEGSWGGPDWQYSGDNRGVGWNTGLYRTRAVFNLVWYANATLTHKDVHPTNRYERRSNGEFVYDSTRTAGADDFDVRALGNDGKYARNVIEHEVGNPYCNSIAGITYANQQDVYQDGRHWIYGSHDKMPDHQFYRLDQIQQDPNDPGSPITDNLTLVFHHELEDPSCLVGVVCGSWRYQYVR